jgi:tight adherence protein B
VIYAIVAFALSLAAVLGAYWAFVVRPEATEKAQLSGRLKTFKVKSANISIEAAPDRVSALPFIEGLLSTKSGLLAPLERLVVESGLKITVGTLLLMMALGGAVGFAIGYVMGRLAVAGILMPVMASIPLIWVKVKRNKRLTTFEEQFPEAVELIARALRAGHAFTTGLGMAADEIKPPVGSEFKRVYDEQNFGMSLVAALRGMAQRIPVLDARFFVTAVLTQRESGGNLSEVLDNLATVMRERFKVKRQIRVISAHGRISAWVLSGLAPGLAGVLFLLSPDFMRILWEDPMGLNLVIAAVVLQVIGTIIISKMVKIEY